MLARQYSVNWHQIYIYVCIPCCFLMIKSEIVKWWSLLSKQYTILHVSSLTESDSQPNFTLLWSSMPFVEFLYPFIDIRLADCFCVHITQSFMNFIPVSSLCIQKLNYHPLLAHGHWHQLLCYSFAHITPSTRTPATQIFVYKLAKADWTYTHHMGVSVLPNVGGKKQSCYFWSAPCVMISDSGCVAHSGTNSIEWFHYLN